MSPFGQAALAAALAALSACASSEMATEQPRAEVATAAAAVTPAPPPPPVVSAFETMRAALATFNLQKNGSGPAAQNEISVVRDLYFTTDSSILPRVEINKLVPLQAYLRTHPLVNVRIEGYGDPANTTARNVDLSAGRAQALARALLTDLAIANSIVAVSAPKQQSAPQNGHAEIILVGP